jgi:hypothetical protein
MQMQWTGRGTTVDYQRVGGKTKFTAQPEKVQGGAYYEIDQLLSGNVDEFVGVVNDLVESMEQGVTSRVFTVLHSAMGNAPAVNRWTGAGITSANFDSVASVIQRYDRKAACIADIDFAKKIAGFVDATYLSDRMKELKNSGGYLTTVNGVDIVVFNNPFANDDTDNTKLVAPKQFSYIVPNGSEKPVKIGFEGDLVQYTSTDIETERVFLKVGQKVSIDVFSDLRNIGELQDTSL